MLANTKNQGPLMDNEELPNLTDKIKVDEQGREYLDNPNMPNGKEYLSSSSITNMDIYRRAARENSTPDSWLNGSPIQYYVPEGYDTNMSYDTLLNPKLREDYFAKQQSLLGLAGKSLVRGVSAITAGTLESLGYLVNPNTYKALFGGEVDEFENQWSKTFRELKESMNDLTDPIYRTIQSKSDSLWSAMFDATFWAGNAESIATTLSLMIPGMAIAKGFGGVGKLLGTTAKTAAKMASIGGAFGSRIMESGMEAKEAFDSFIEQHKLDDEYVNDEAKLRIDAGKAASMTMQANMPLFLIDAFQFDSILHGFTSFKDAATRAKRLANVASKYGWNALSEGTEEGIQYVIQKEAEYNAIQDPEVKKLLGETFSERWDKYTDDIEFKTSILLGAAGGGLFSAAGPIINRVYDKALNRLNSYNAAKEIAALKNDKNAFDQITDIEFEDQVAKHYKADTLDTLISTYKDKLNTVPEDQKQTVQAYVDRLSSIQETLTSLSKFDQFKNNKKLALMYALTEQDGYKQEDLNKVLIGELSSAVQTTLADQESKAELNDVIAALRVQASKQVLKDFSSLKRINEIDSNIYKKIYKNHIEGQKALGNLSGKNINIEDVLAKNPKIEEIAYNLERNFAERGISIEIIKSLNKYKTAAKKEETKSSPKATETKTETPVSEPKSETSEDKKEKESVPSGSTDVVGADAFGLNKEKEEKVEETKPTPKKEESEPELENDPDALAEEYDDFEQAFTDAFSRDLLESTEGEDVEGEKSVKEMVNTGAESILNAPSFSDYLNSKAQAAKASAKSTLAKNIYDTVIANEEDQLRDFDFNTPTQSQALAAASKFIDLGGDFMAGQLLYEAMSEHRPVGNNLLGAEDLAVFDQVLDYIQKLQEAKQYADVKKGTPVDDTIPKENPNEDQQKDPEEPEVIKRDPLRIFSFKYRTESYTGANGRPRLRNLEQDTTSKIYNSYINFDETIKPEVANVGSTVFFGIPEDFLKNQSKAEDADILVYDENNNGISWIRKEFTAAKFGANDIQIAELKKQRALLYQQALKHTGETILINGKRVIPCNVSSTITAKSYGLITHDAENYYPIKDALQVDNASEITLGAVVGSETSNYSFVVPNPQIPGWHTPPMDEVRTGHIFALVQSANGTYYPLRVYTRKFSELNKDSKLYRYYDRHIKDAFNAIQDDNATKSSMASNSLNRYVVIRLVKNNNAELPYMKQEWVGNHYEDVEAMTREQALQAIQDSLINIPANFLNSGDNMMNAILDSDVLQMNIIPGEPFHSPTYSYSSNLVTLEATTPIETKVEPTKKVKVTEPQIIEPVTDPVEKSFEDNSAPKKAEDVPQESKKRGKLLNPNSKLAQHLKGKNIVKPDLSRRDEWGKDMDRYRLTSKGLPKESKIRNADGTPIDLYFGSEVEINKFEFDKGTDPFIHFGPLHIAQQFGKYIKRVNLDIRNPLIIEEDYIHESPSSMFNYLYKIGKLSLEEYSQLRNESSKVLRETLLRLGYDGIQYRNYGEGQGEWSYGVVKEGQIYDAETGELLRKTNNSYTKWNQEKELNWLKENLPQLSENDLVKIHKGLINVGSLTAWGRFKDGIIEISDEAAEGTAYHEAFHAVFNMFLTESEANALLNKARKKFNLEGKSDVTVEEHLADQFREYVNDNAKTKSILDKISDFFKNIYHIIKNKLHLNPSIEQVFYDINRGRYAHYKVKGNKLVERTWLSNITPSIYKRRVNMLVDAFEDLIDNLVTDYPNLSRTEVIKQNSIEDYILAIHDQFYDAVHGSDPVYTTPESRDAVDLMLDELLTFDAEGNPIFGQLTLDVLKEISTLEGVTFKAKQIVDADMNVQDQVDDFMNDEDTVKQEGWQIDQSTVAAITKLRQSTRNIIRRIPKVRPDGTLVAPDDLGYQPYMSSTEVFATLLGRLSNMSRPSDLLTSLEVMRTNFPWVAPIIDKINSDPKIKTDFYNSFRSDAVEYMLVQSQDDGTMRVFPGNALNKGDEVTKTWSSNLAMADKTKAELLSDIENSLKKIIELKTKFSSNQFRLGTLKTWINNWKSGPFINADLKRYTKELAEASHVLGFDFTPDELYKIFSSSFVKQEFNKTTLRPLDEVMINLFKVFNASKQILSKEDFKDRQNLYAELELLPVKRAITELGRRAASVRSDLYESSLREDGKTYSTNVTPSFIGKLFKRLTNHDDLSQFETFKKSFFYTNNKGEFTHPWLKELYRAAKNPFSTIETRVSTFLHKDKVKYTELSKPDFLGSKINLWYNNGAQMYSYYMTPIPSDGSSMPVIRFRKYAIEDCMDGLVALAKSEINRIEVVKKRQALIKEGKIHEIINFDRRGDKFLMFPFLNKYNINDLKSSEEDLRNYIEQAVEEGFEAFKKDPNLDPTKYDKRIAESTLKQFYYNDLMAQMSILTLTSVDLAFYKSDIDFFKRNKQIMSPGHYGDWESLGIPEKFTAIRLKDNEIPSLVGEQYYTNLRANGVSVAEAMTIAAKFGYSNATDSEGKRIVKLPNGKTIKSGLNNSTDGQTFITLDRYRNIARMNSKWDDSKEASYQRIKNGTYNMEDILTFSLQPIKPYMYAPHTIDANVDYNGGRTSIYQPLQNKNSEAVLIPQMLKGNKLLTALAEGMEANGIDAVYFESAVKEGIELNTSEEIKEKQRAKGEQVLPDAILKFNGDPNELKNVVKYELSNDDYMYQMDTPEHFKDALQLLGSQFRKHIIANLGQDAKFNLNGVEYNGLEIADLFDKILAWNYDKNFRKVQDKIGSIEGLAQELQNSVMQRKFAENTVEAVQLMNWKGQKVFKLPLYFPIQSNRIFQMISSIFRNNIVRSKINGGALYQVSSYGFDDRLKVHMKDGHIEYVDAIVPYMYGKHLAKYANADGMINTSKIEDKELLKMICYRIPTEDKYSSFPLRIVGFSSPAEGGIIKLPVDTVTIAGFDFDIDKLYFMNYATKYTPGSYDLGKIRSFLVNSGYLNDRFTTGDYKSELEYLRNLLESYDEGNKLSEEETKAMSEVFKLLKEYPQLIKQDSKLEKIKYDYNKAPKDQSVEASNNALIDIAYSILTSNDAFKTMVSGANTEMFSRVIDTLATVEGNNANSSDRLFDASYMTNTHYEYMAGKALTGVFASNSANHSMLQFYDVNFKSSPIYLDGKGAQRISPVKTLDGTQNVTNVLGSFLATVVDNAKTLTASKVNLNLFTASTYTLLLRLGHNPETVMYFMSQPSLKQLSDRVLASGNLFNFDSILNNLITEYENSLDKKLLEDVNKSRIKFYFNQGDLITAINDYYKGTNPQIENAKQILVLKAFKNLITPSTTLRQINSAMRSETYGSAPTYGDMESQRMKFLKLKAKQSVEGLDDVLIWMPRGEKYEEFMESPITKKSFVAANTNGVVEYMRYTDKLSPFNKGNFNFIKNTVANGIKEDLNGSDIDAINEMVMNYFTKQLDFFKFNEKQTKAWIYEYPKRFSKIVENDPYLKNVNEFTKRLSVQTLPQRTLNGRERLQIIKYSGSRFDNEVAKDESIRAYEYLWRTPKYTKLAEDLLKYNFVLNGWGLNNNSFNHVIPISMINNIPGFNELFREQIFTSNLLVNESLADNFFLNNYRDNRLVPEFTKETGGVKFIGNKDHTGLEVEKFSDMTIYEIGEDYDNPYRFLKFNNNGKIELYKHTGQTQTEYTYTRVGALGTGQIFEFGSGESIFASNNLSSKTQSKVSTDALLKAHDVAAEIELSKHSDNSTIEVQKIDSLNESLQEVFSLDQFKKVAEQIKNHCKGK